ncbi:lipid-transfer protein [Mycobacterium antarcticum]|uniref:lipid-transfer protein n=1 Tax=Mycolicibacterium sp. TUM20985 TaxID=3023370 RepID=UPI0025740482|nr:lipid-transfer protein [Mycolicibacterium sp. TUM20985]BDX33670.1 lipid-transfer protein [Mycolicibacterium sp. TUM20985]
MSGRVFVVGTGMTKFEKPGRRENWNFPDMVKESVPAALADAGLEYSDIQTAFASFVQAPTCSGQRALYEVGLTGIPVINVNNACASGSTGLFLARQAVSSGALDCALAVGFEQMAPGSLSLDTGGLPTPLDKHLGVLAEMGPFSGAPLTLEMFARAGMEHIQKYGSTPEHFGWIGWKNHHHSVNNPYAQFQKDFTLEEVMASAAVAPPLTKLQCSPTSDGSAASILASERFVDEHDLWAKAIEIIGQALETDQQSSFDPPSAIKVVGADVSARAARRAYDMAGVGPEDIDVIELHDCFSVNEVLTYEALGMAAEGEGHLLVDKQDTTYGGRWVVNPSGGLISKGHPLGATGLAQCNELTWQLRGTADARQVDGAVYALQHNLGLGGAGVVTIYAKPTR